MSTRTWITALSFVGTVAATTLAASDSSACGGGIWTPPTEEGMVSIAEYALERGDYAAAADIISSRFWYIRGSHPHAGSAPLIKRAIRVLALSAARADGKVRVGAPYSFGPEAANKKNREWAVSRVRQLEKADPNSATAANDVGEVLVRDPKTQAEGKAKLLSLFHTGKLQGAYNHNQLATLLAADGHRAESQRVASACRASFGSSCVSTDAPGSSAVASR